LFAEALIPVTDTVELNAAIRYDDYSDFGSEVSPSLSGVWRATDSISVRARWSQGFRAPAMAELYGPETFSAEDATDYWRCEQNGIAAEDCQEGQVDTYYRTNPDLDAETSTTFSFGGNWNFAENWTADLGWWMVEIEETISQASTQEVFYAETAGVVMTPADPTYVDRTSARAEVYSSYLNAGELNVEGVDFQLNGSFPTNYGEFTVNWLWSHNLKYEQEVYPNGPVQETKGFWLQPEDKTQLVLGWSWNNHSVSWVTDYLGDFSVSDSISVDANGVPSLVTSREKMDTYMTMNLSYTYDAAEYGNIKIGARNITDEEPVLDKSNTFARDTYELYDPTQRVYYVEYKLSM
jgi:iron complex outermembrane receptor protein